MSHHDEPHETLRRVFRTLHMPAGPFADEIPSRALFEAGEGSHLHPGQLVALARAGGAEVLLAEYVWDWHHEPEVLAFHRMDLRASYPPLEELAGPGMEHALVALDGSWGVLTTDDLYAVVGGEEDFVAAALPGLGPAGAAAAPGLLDEHPDWGPGLLEHLYGGGWQAALGLDVPRSGSS